MRTDYALEKLACVAPYLADIADKMKKDDTLSSFIKDYKGDKSNNVGFALRFIPTLLNKCNVEVYEILSILNDKPIEEVKAQSISETVKELVNIAKDEDFKSFFSLFTETPQEGIPVEE